MPYKFVFLSLSLFGVLTYIDSSVSYSGAVSLYKQLLLVIVLISFLSTIKNRRTDPLMLLGITFFVFSLTIFTLFQLNDISDLFVLSGYITALLIFYFSSKSDFNIGFYIKKSLVFLGFIFLLTAIMSFGSGSSVSLKGQYQGYFGNANTFAGLAGLFFTLFFCQYLQSQKIISKYLYIVSSFILLVFIFLAFSRGVILSVSAVTIFSLFKFGRKFKLLLVLFVGLIGFYYLLFGKIQSLDLNRDVFEDTGRLLIFQEYYIALSERLFFFGTGVSIEMGRIKSELSYLDVWLSSGLGLLGFLLYLFRSLYLSFRLSDVQSIWATSLFLYICISSIFEGYVANVASIPSILFYIIPAIIWMYYRSNRLTLSNRTA